MKKKTRMFEMLVFLSFFCALTIEAWEPPRPNIREAIKKSKILFVGRVVEIKETKNSDFEKRAVAKIEVIHCYRCSGKDIPIEIEVEYITEALEDYVMGLNLAISEEVLFVINQSAILATPILFDSKLPGGVDFAFFISVEDYTRNFASKFLSNEKGIWLTNLYWEKQNDWILKSEIEEIVSSSK